MRTIRLATASDAAGVREIYGPIVAGTAISFEYEVPGEAEMGRRIEAVLGFAPWLVCADGARIDGYANAARHRERAGYQWSVDVNVYVHERCRRAGVGRALYTSLFALLRLQGFHAAHAGIWTGNAESIALHERLGFRRIGTYPRVGYKHGAWRDTGWWQLELRERAGAPAPVRSMEALRSDPAWEEALRSGEALLRR